MTKLTQRVTKGARKRVAHGDGERVTQGEGTRVAGVTQGDRKVMT